MADLEIRDVSKAFPGVLALDRVGFQVRSGEVRALCGENGAGKSTLLKVLSGVHRPDHGAVLLDGVPVRLGDPTQSHRSGIVVIDQELQLWPNMTVAENLFLGRLPSDGPRLNRPRLERDAREALSEVGLNVDPSTPLEALPLAQRQLVEIARALARGARVIAFDEPTSSLSAREAEILFALIARLREAGRIVLYVSHRLHEVFRICDSTTVLRDGRLVTTFATHDGLEKSDVVAAMVGRTIDDVYGYRARETGSPALTARGVLAEGLSEPADLEVRAGEIVGLFGLIGSGRTELLRALFGGARRRGTVLIGDAILSDNGPAASLRRGLAMLTEDRRHEGIIPELGVGENIALGGRDGAGLWIDAGSERARAQALVDRLEVRTPALDKEIALLSGGNQQKALLARCLWRDPNVLLLDEPTRGVDVAAKREIYDILFDLAERGVALLLATSELPEALGVCDRVLVMRHGRVVGCVARADATEQRLLELALPEAS